MTERRLFVGNLPKDISESKIEKLFGKYEISKIELKRKKVLDDESVFAFVNISAKNVDECLSELSNKQWRDYKLKVELAKESFLDRLRKEHSEKNMKNNAKSDDQFTNNSFQLRQNISGPKNKKLKFDIDNELEESESTNLNDNFPEDVPRKRNLPMFRGTASIITTETKSYDPVTKQNSDKKIDIKNSANEAYSAMKRFEDFSDVWKDEPVLNNLEYKKINFKGKFNLVEGREKKPSSWKISPLNDNYIENESQSNHTEEKKELQSWKIPRSNDDHVESEPPKRTKIKSEPTDIGKDKILQWKRAIPISDFQNYPNKTKREEEQSVKWKTVVPEDDRFQLDEKFFDDNDIPILNSKQKKKSSNVGSVEDKFQKNGVAKDVFEHRQLIRYDPTRPDHKILEKKSSKSQPAILSEKKKKTKKKLEKHKVHQKEAEKPEPAKPEVSKEKHYEVADTLVNAFKKVENRSEFRLSSLFDEKIKKENPSLPKHQTNAEEVPMQKPAVENILEHDSCSGEEEDEIEESPVKILLPEASEKVLGKCGVWGETFFFKEDDSRLKEAIDFFKPEDKKKIIDFDKLRVELREIVRKKLQNSKKDNKLFKEKLGGKLNKSKFKKRLKNAGHHY